MRKEKDALGEAILPDESYYGIQTLRAMQNFAISDITFNRYLKVVYALTEIKKSCAMTNKTINALPANIADAIIQACDELLSGKFSDQFPVNVFRGCGTSINMNVNEVLANRANEIITGSKGKNVVHPNTHVNMCQSSNDVFPTAASIVLYRESRLLNNTLKELEKSIKEKIAEFGHIVRIGRTCLQDAVPLTYAQSLSGYISLLERNRKMLSDISDQPVQGILGATAVGTGIGVQPGFMEYIYQNLSDIVGFAVIPKPNFFDGIQNSDGAMYLSALIRNTASACGKIAHDFLLLSSGPYCGIGELKLDSSVPDPHAIYVCKYIIQLVHLVCSNDWAICMAAQIGEPDIGPSGGIKFITLLDSITLVQKAVLLLSEQCIRYISVDEERSYRHARESMSLATIFATIYDYSKGSQLVQIASKKEMTCPEAAIEEGMLTQDAANEIFDIHTLTDRNHMENIIRKYRNEI